MSKFFPCWVCKGEGSWVEPVTDERQGPVDSCGYCQGEGMIEIGGKVHRRITAEAIGMKIIKFQKPEQLEWEYKEIIELGERALNLLHSSQP